MRGKVIRYGPGVLAVLALTGDAVTTFLHPGPSADHGFLDVLAILVGGWAIADCYARRIGPRLQPGQQVISGEEMSRFEQAVVQGYREAGNEQGGTQLRSAS